MKQYFVIQKVYGIKIKAQVMWEKILETEENKDQICLSGLATHFTIRDLEFRSAIVCH